MGSRGGGATSRSPRLHWMPATSSVVMLVTVVVVVATRDLSLGVLAGALFFGRNAVRVHLKDACERLGAKRAFVVTDSILVRAGLLAQTAEPLTALDVTFAHFGSSSLVQRR